MANAKRKCTFTNEMQEKHPCFRKGRNDYEAECLVCKSETYISVVHKGNADLNTHLQSEKHRKAVRGDVALTKMRQIILLQQEANAKMKSLPQKALLHFTLFSIIIAFCPWTVHRFHLKKIFPDSNVANKFSRSRTKTEKVFTGVLVQYSIDAVLKSFEEKTISHILALQQMAAITMNRNYFL